MPVVYFVCVKTGSARVGEGERLLTSCVAVIILASISLSFDIYSESICFFISSFWTFFPSCLFLLWVSEWVLILFFEKRNHETKIHISAVFFENFSVYYRFEFEIWECLLITTLLGFSSSTIIIKSLPSSWLLS